MRTDLGDSSPAVVITDMTGVDDELVADLCFHLRPPYTVAAFVGRPLAARAERPTSLDERLKYRCSTSASIERAPVNGADAHRRQ
jgi:hypothetical protein